MTILMTIYYIETDHNDVLDTSGILYIHYRCYFFQLEFRALEMDRVPFSSGPFLG